MIAPWYFIYFKMRENNFSLLFFMLILLFLVVPCYLISSSIWYCFSNKQLAILELIAIVHTSIRLSEIIITAPKKNRPVNFFVAVFGPAANYSIIITIFPSSIVYTAQMTNAFLVYTLVCIVRWLHGWFLLEIKSELKNEPFDEFLGTQTIIPSCVKTMICQFLIKLTSLAQFGL